MSATHSAEKLMADMNRMMKSGLEVEEVKLKYTLLEEEVSMELE